MRTVVLRYSKVQRIIVGYIHCEGVAVRRSPVCTYNSGIVIVVYCQKNAAVTHSRTGIILLAARQGHRDGIITLVDMPAVQVRPGKGIATSRADRGKRYVAYISPAGGVVGITDWNGISNRCYCCSCCFYY